MTAHVHSWVFAPDWEWGPGRGALECAPCGGLRVLTIPDDPEWLANLLPTHRYCDTAHRGHQSCVDEAARLLAAMRGAA